MELDINSALLLIIVFQFLFVSIFLFTNKKGKRISNTLLGICFLAISLNLMDMLFYMMGVYHLVGLLSMLDLALILSFGPLCYLYCQSIIYRDFRLRWSSLAHFVPFFLIAVLVVYNFMITPNEDQTEILDQLYEFRLTTEQAMVVIPFYLHVILYIILSVKLVRRSVRIVAEEYSDVKPVMISWLRFLLGSFLTITVVSMLLSILPYTPLDQFVRILMAVFIILMFFVINRILLMALRKPVIFSGISQDQDIPKYSSSKLSEQDKADYENAIRSVMKENSPFLDPGLSLKQLSEILGIRSRHVSQVINERMHLTFHDYINSLRVEYARGLMQKAEEKVSILEILYESGFNSKSSFNSAFKKVSGITPTEYRRSIRNN